MARDGIDRRAMVALSGGHLAVDFASGSVPALIPFLTDKFHLGYALAALLLLAATASSSLVQPLFGLWSDRRGALWLIPGGAVLAAVGVAGAAVAPAYPLVLVLVLAGGLGVAAFHPEGAKFASYASGRKRASGMSYFNIGGNTGYALGAFATLALGPVADRIGLRRTLVATQALIPPLMLVFVYVGGVPGAVALMLVGVCVVGTFGVTMVLSQLYLPRQVGMASGLSVGLAMGIGGVAAVVLGAVADAVDLKVALTA